MLTEKQFDKLKKNYGDVSSFAIWASQSNPQRKLSGTSNLSVFNNCLSIVNPTYEGCSYVFVALNAAAHPINNSINNYFDSFHCDYRYSKDWVLREIFKNSPVYGSYITDLYKYSDCNGTILNETDSKEAKKKITSQVEEYNINALNDELNIIDRKIKLIAFGYDAYEVLSKWFYNGMLSKNVCSISKTLHFSCRKSISDKKNSFDNSL